jgi:hypothetical protein
MLQQPDVAQPGMAAWFTCKRERPWGVHACIEGGRCPRCGWTNGAAAHRAGTGAS